MNEKNKVFEIIEEISSMNDFRDNENLDLFEEGILDSMRAIMLIVQLENEFEISLPPSEIDRNAWNTAAKIAQRIEEKVHG